MKKNPPETERPKRTHLNSTGVVKEILQAWVVTGESCPEGTIPIRRTTEEDMLRARTIRRFGKKPHRVRRDSTGSGHEVRLKFKGRQSDRQTKKNCTS